MDVLTLKVAGAGAILLIGLVCGLLPLRLERSEASRHFFSLANAAAGGVFLGAALMHMFPDGMDAVAGLDLDYPVVELLAGAGFFLVLLLEHGIMAGRDESALAGAAAQGSVYPYVLLLVLSIHSVIAGVALGLETTVMAGAAIVIAVVAHKGSAAFALGVSMSRGGVPAGRASALATLFSLTTPLGAVAGIAAGSLLAGPRALLAEGIFDGLASGTFLYVAILDIIREEFEQPRNRWAKLGLLLLGLTVMAVVAIWS